MYSFFLVQSSSCTCPIPFIYNPRYILSLFCIARFIIYHTVFLTSIVLFIYSETIKNYMDILSNDILECGLSKYLVYNMMKLDWGLMILDFGFSKFWNLKMKQSFRAKLPIPCHIIRIFLLTINKSLVFGMPISYFGVPFKKTFLWGTTQ